MEVGEGGVKVGVEINGGGTGWSADQWGWGWVGCGSC